jgi:hypothetical protein
MSRMIDLMRQSAVPSHILRAASKGALAVPPEETIEILVFLTANPVFRDEASMTLSTWDENSCLAVAANPDSPPEVLAYFANPANLRSSLLPVLLENNSVSDSALAAIAAVATAANIAAVLASPRASWSPEALNALLSNPKLPSEDAQQVRSLLREIEPMLEYEREHAAEIAAEADKPFHLVGGTDQENHALAEARELNFLKSPKPFVLPRMGETPPPAPAGVPAAAAAAAPKLTKAPEEREHLSTLQKVSRLKVGERVQLAMKGNKDERFLLVRDGAKVVAQAVLESPKLSESEAELFSSMKNVQEVVLRGLAGKRKFARNYRIQRNLAFNPKCPIDVALHLCSNLILGDLKALSTNKEVPETVKKQALRLFVQKSDSRKS